jgi:hypothetical protein
MRHIRYAGPVRLTGCQATPYVHSERSISNQSLNSILTTAAPAAPKAPASQKKRKVCQAACANYRALL